MSTERGARARELFLSGKNCTQAVMLAFSEELGIDPGIVARIALPMGGGMGRLRETCGAVSGAVMCLGLIFPEGDRAQIYPLVQEVAEKFRSMHGSIRCGELLTGAGIASDRSPTPEARTAAYYKKRPCPELIASAAEILEEVIRAHRGA